MSQSEKQVSLNVLCVPGPSGRGEARGIDYFHAAIKRLAPVTEGVDVKVLAAGYTDHFPTPQSSHIAGLQVEYLMLPRDVRDTTGTQMSTEHGSLLNALRMASNQTDSDYTIVMDPDFFMLGQVQLLQVVHYMRTSEIELLGATYPTNRIHQYWDFPVAFFQVWKTEAFKALDLDFRPRWASGGTRRDEKILWRDHLDQRVLRLLSRLRVQKSVDENSRSEPTLTPHQLMQRPRFWKLGQYTYDSDTGCRIRERVSSRTNFEGLQLCINQSAQPNTLADFNIREYHAVNQDVPGDLAQWHAAQIGIYAGRPLGRQRLLWKLAALAAKHRWRYTGSQSASHLIRTPDEFRSHGRGDLYFWRGRPLGVHLSSIDKISVADDLPYVEELVECAARYVGRVI